MAPGRATAAAWAASGAVAAAAGAAAGPIPAHAKGNCQHTAVTSMSVCGRSQVRGKTSVHVGLCATRYVLVP